jgi:sugar O-acyltransferase (sialic acid O-acetyltransferase NeuD family)
MNKHSIIIGAGGHCRSILSILKKLYPNIKIYIQAFKKEKDEKIFNIKLQIFKKKIIKNCDYYLGIGDQKDRKKLYNFFSKKIKLKNLISGSSSIGIDLKIGYGNFIGELCYLGPFSKIGNNNIINTKCSIDHEVKIGNNCNIAPGVNIAGKVTIGNNVVIGIGANIINNIKICDNTIVGASSFVNKSIVKSGVYYGTPAKKIYKI